MIRCQSSDSTATAATLELTPLIDIIFIVVVFLLLTANSRLLVLPVDIPQADSAWTEQASDKPSLTITLQQQPPHWAIDNKPYQQWSDFKLALQQEVNDHKDQQPGIHIAPDKDAPVELLVKLMALLNENQMRDVQILIDPAH